MWIISYTALKYQTYCHMLSSSYMIIRTATFFLPFMCKVNSQKVVTLLCSWMNRNLKFSLEIMDTAYSRRERRGTFGKHINAAIKTSFFHLRILAKLKPFLGFESFSFHPNLTVLTVFIQVSACHCSDNCSWFTMQQHAGYLAHTSKTFVFKQNSRVYHLIFRSLNF